MGRGTVESLDIPEDQATQERVEKVSREETLGPIRSPAIEEK